MEFVDSDADSSLDSFIASEREGTLRSYQPGDSVIDADSAAGDAESVADWIEDVPRGASLDRVLSALPPEFSLDRGASGFRHKPYTEALRYNKPVPSRIPVAAGIRRFLDPRPLHERTSSIMSATSAKEGPEVAEEALTPRPCAQTSKAQLPAEADFTTEGEGSQDDQPAVIACRAGKSAVARGKRVRAVESSNGSGSSGNNGEGPGPSMTKGKGKVETGKAPVRKAQAVRE